MRERGSFAPLRVGCQAVCHVGGREYFAAVAEAFSRATEEIFIAGWQVNPDVLLVRPPIRRTRPRSSLTTCSPLVFSSSLNEAPAVSQAIM